MRSLDYPADIPVGDGFNTKVDVNWTDRLEWQMGQLNKYLDSNLLKQVRQ